ncbi:MAG TPA: hypothetical protein VGA38_04140 [Candidatus Limnocylindria bacterium]
MRNLVLLSAVLIGACQSTSVTPVDPMNATYTVNQRQVTMSNGIFEEPAAPGSAAKTTTRVSDKGAVGELNADGRPDAAAILVSSGGGSGTFYYLAAVLGAAIGKGDSTNAIQLGDRIVVDSVRIEGGKIAVDIVDRRPGDPFTTAPSVKVTRTFQVKDRTLVEIK